MTFDRQRLAEALAGGCMFLGFVSWAVGAHLWWTHVYGLDLMMFVIACLAFGASEINAHEAGL